jgi:hypothetical protein
MRMSLQRLKNKVPLPSAKARGECSAAPECIASRLQLFDHTGSLGQPQIWLLHEFPHAVEKTGGWSSVHYPMVEREA